MIKLCSENVTSSKSNHYEERNECALLEWTIITFDILLNEAFLFLEGNFLLQARH